MGAARRFFIESPVNIGDTAMITGGEYRHMAEVLRAKTGDKVILLAGDGFDLHGEITEITKNSASVKIDKKEKNAAEPIRYAALFAGAPKGDKAEFTVQKAVELGLSEVVFFDSAYAVSKQKEEKSARFSRVAAEAVKQCGRAKVPEITAAVSFKGMCERLKTFDFILFANERESVKTLNAVLPAARTARRIALITGSEGGFSAEEAAILVNSGAVSCTFGARILRAETAAVALAAIVMNYVSEDEI